MSKYFATQWFVVCQAPLSMEFSRHEYWSGLPFSSPGDLHDVGIESISPALAGGLFSMELTEKYPLVYKYFNSNLLGDGDHKEHDSQSVDYVYEREREKKKKKSLHNLSCYCCSVAKSCLTLCNPMDCSTPSSSVLQFLPDFVHTYVH